jgi:hypothetical protein
MRPASPTIIMLGVTCDPNTPPMSVPLFASPKLLPSGQAAKPLDKTILRRSAGRDSQACGKNIRRSAIDHRNSTNAGAEDWGKTTYDEKITWRTGSDVPLSPETEMRVIRR